MRILLFLAPRFRAPDFLDANQMAIQGLVPSRSYGPLLWAPNSESL